jgi:hypothetical protein
VYLGFLISSGKYLSKNGLRNEMSPARYALKRLFCFMPEVLDMFRVNRVGSSKA